MTMTYNCLIKLKIKENYIIYSRRIWSAFKLVKKILKLFLINKIQFKKMKLIYHYINMIINNYNIIMIYRIIKNSI